VEDVPKLSEEHLEKAKEIISRHRTKKNCKRCYDRGYQGVNQLNMAITCYKCVDEEKVTEEWQAYVRDTPALAQAYGDYFEADEAEEAEIAGEEKPQVTHEQGRRVSADRSRRGGASQPHRSVGR
jgi:superfamily II DNA helicase RecQ